MLTDAGSIALALVAARLAARPPAGGFTYGLGRAEILSAQVNGASLLVLAGVIAWEAVGRLGDPPDVEGLVVLLVGLAGAGVNVAAAWALSRAERRSLEHRGRARARARRPLRVARSRPRGPARAHRGAGVGGRRRRAARRRADGAVRLQPARPVGARAARGRAARDRPRRRRPRARVAPGRDRGPRPARLGGHVRASRRSPRTCSCRRGRTATRAARSSSSCWPSASGSSTRRCRSSTRLAGGCSTSSRVRVPALVNGGH